MQHTPTSSLSICSLSYVHASEMRPNVCLPMASVHLRKGPAESGATRPQKRVAGVAVAQSNVFSGCMFHTLTEALYRASRRRSVYAGLVRT